MQTVGDFKWRVKLPFEDLEAWEEITSTLLKPQFKSLSEFSNALSYYHFKGTTKMSLDGVAEALNIFATTSLETTVDGTTSTSKYHFDFLSEVLPFVQLQALSLPYHFTKGHLSILDSAGSLSLPRQAVCCLLACAFFWLFRKDTTICKQDQSRLCPFNLPGLDWTTTMQHHSTHCACILHYFNQCRISAPVGYMKITRKVLQEPLTVQDWMISTKPLSEFHIHTSGAIEDSLGMLQADFANSSIGGGVLQGGCVQEEIRFCINTELLVSLLLCTPMKDNEAITLWGTERFSQYSGYGGSFNWSGPHTDPDKDTSGQPQTRIVAFDALIVWKEGAQFSQDAILRELNKAMIAFQLENDEDPLATDSQAPAEISSSAPFKRGITPRTPRTLSLMSSTDSLTYGNNSTTFNKPSTPTTSGGRKLTSFGSNKPKTTYIEKYGTSIATGNWGCGMFGGCSHIKSIIQWLAASQNKRNVHYYVFNQTQLVTTLNHIIECVTNNCSSKLDLPVTVGRMAQWVLGCPDDMGRSEFHPWLLNEWGVAVDMRPTSHDGKRQMGATVSGMLAKLDKGKPANPTEESLLDL